MVRYNTHQWLIKKDVFNVISLILLRCFDQIKDAEIVEVSKSLAVRHCTVAVRLAGPLNNLIHKLWRIFKRQFSHLLKNAFAQRAFLLHEVDMVVNPPHHKLVANLQGIAFFPVLTH